MTFDELKQAIDEWCHVHTFDSFARACKDILEDEEIALLVEALQK